MSENTSGAVKPAGNYRAPLLRVKSLRIIGVSYLIVLVFLMVFLVTLVKGSVLKESLGEPQWAILVAFVAVFPLLLPGLMTHVLPRISSIKISELAELSFTKAEVSTYSLAALADQLKGIPEQASAPEYACMMTSYSSVIMEAIKNIQKTKDEILVVDLREGKAWIPPNLYFLALLAGGRTAVRQIAFVETRHVEDVFVGMCSPEEIVEGLSGRFPLLDVARNKSLQEDQSLSGSGPAFFGALGAAYAAVPDIPRLKDMWLNGSVLCGLLGTRIHREHVQWEEPLSEKDCRYILRGSHPYVAAVEEDQLQFMISRDRLALLVARELAQKSAT